MVLTSSSLLLSVIPPPKIRADSSARNRSLCARNSLTSTDKLLGAKSETTSKTEEKITKRVILNLAMQRESDGERYPQPASLTRERVTDCLA